MSVTKIVLLLLCILAIVRFDARADDVDFQRDIRPLFQQYCVACHNGIESDSTLLLDTYSSILNGSENGKVIVPNEPEQSKLFRVLSGLEEPHMPPAESKQPAQAEIELIRRWIQSGAQGKDVAVPLRDRLRVPHFRSAYAGKTPITAAALISDRSQLLLGRFHSLDLVQGQWQSKLPIDIVGKVTQIRVSKDGSKAVIAVGIPGVGGQAIVLDLSAVDFDRVPQKSIQVIEGHRDILYTAVLSPDGAMLATGGYDRSIMLWNLADGTLIRKLDGHNGAVYDLDFDQSGKVLASASGDETIKIWRVSDGERLDTLGQGEAEQYVVRFDDARGRVLAVGADKRIRVWQVMSKSEPTVSPLLHATFAHDAPIQQLAISPDGKSIATSGDDKQVKVWDAETIEPRATVGRLDDVASGLLWNSDSKSLIATTLGGEVRRFEVLGSVVPVTSQADPAMNASAAESLTSTNEAPSEVTEVTEVANLHSRANPQVLSVPSKVQATFAASDVSSPDGGDWYAFDAEQNKPLVLSINAARNGSQLDSQIDVFDVNGAPVLRTRLQAVRESYFTFRGKDSMNVDDFRMHRWEDMELNEYLYAGGEVVKFWLYPRGPDSGFKTYPGTGNRYTYFGTSATSHALNEPAWIVRDIGVQRDPISNGLPVFPIYYSNDDDPNRRGGKDSEMIFRAPATGRYLVRVRDARGLAGDKFTYQLSIVRPRPRFAFRIEQGEVTLRAKASVEFSVVVDRFDECDEPIEFIASDLPEGVTITQPLTIEREQIRAIGLIVCDPEKFASLPKQFSVKLTARALGGKNASGTTEEKSLVIKTNEKPTVGCKLFALNDVKGETPLQELVIAPGQTISARVIVERGGYEGEIAFGGDDSGRNLPHGSYVSNVGLNGLLLLVGQNSREVYITAAPWLPSGERWFHLRANVDGNPTTQPVKLRIERK